MPCKYDGQDPAAAPVVMLKAAEVAAVYEGVLHADPPDLGSPESRAGLESFRSPQRASPAACQRGRF